MDDDTQISTPKRIGQLPGPLARRIHQTKARCQYEDVKERIREGVNKCRVRDGFPPYTPSRFGLKLKPYMDGVKLMPQKLMRLYRLEGNCREAERCGFGYSKSFECAMTEARKESTKEGARAQMQLFF